VPIFAGIVISFVLFALAGYVLVLTGLFARTTIVLSWWLAVAAAFEPRALPICRLAGAPSPARRDSPCC